MQTRFPTEEGLFIKRLADFFGTAATADRRVLSIDTLREQFMEQVPYERQTIEEIIGVWQRDISVLGPELGLAARTAHEKRSKLPVFADEVIVAYTGNTLADAHRILMPEGRFTVPKEVWPADSLFEDYQRIIDLRQ